MIVGPRRSGRTVALLLAAVAMADVRHVYFVCWSQLEASHAEDLLKKHFPAAEYPLPYTIEFVVWCNLPQCSCKPCIFDHRVTEQLSQSSQRGT